ncbi:MAG: hypothetical protein ACPGXL_04015 [Chitinophagales bacterium]
MNIKTHLLPIFFVIATLILLSACHQKQEEQIENKHQQEKNTSKGRAYMERQWGEDDIRLDSVLQEATSFAKRHIGKDTMFRVAYEATPDTSHSVSVTIAFDHFFSKKSKHLIIRREGVHAVGVEQETAIMIYTNIYAIDENKQLSEVLAHDQWDMEYVSDTIRDINGDGRKDFTVNFYGVNGCCLKSFSVVYLLRADYKGFSDGNEFINPTFSPKEGVVRGVRYGHPKETEMYKFKWHRESLDTIEYLFFQQDENGKYTGKFIRAPKLNFELSSKDKIDILDAPPKEYESIYGFNWFMGDF